MVTVRPKKYSTTLLGMLFMIVSFPHQSNPVKNKHTLTGAGREKTGVLLHHFHQLSLQHFLVVDQNVPLYA